MNDPDPSSTARPAHRESLLHRLRSLFSSERDSSLRESVEDAIENHETQNPEESIGEQAKAMMLKLIGFSDMRVDDVMVPRTDIVATEDTASVRELLDRFIAAGHSRIPIYHETLDEISGMVHIKDLLRWMTLKGAKPSRRRSAKVPQVSPLSLSAADLATTIGNAGIMREVLFVPPSMPAAELLVTMQSRHIHLAIVVDEYGGTDGLCSIEDLVEEIVGDISDEHDPVEDELVLKSGEDTFVADARTSIDELEDILGIDLLPEKSEETETLGGLAFSMLGRVPSIGERLHHESGVEFEILDADARRVKRILIDAKGVRGNAHEG
ncbi:MAG: hemolysin family protein [Hyphomicrobiales bacterium]